MFATSIIYVVDGRMYIESNSSYPSKATYPLAPRCCTSILILIFLIFTVEAIAKSDTQFL